MTRGALGVARVAEDETAATDHLNIVIVTFNSERHLESVLASIPDAVGRLSTTTVVVDNGSTDGTVALARSHPGVQVVETGANLGYSGGINVARRHLGGGTLAVLNPDVVLDPSSLETLVGHLEDGVGIAVPRLRDGEGAVFHHLRTEPTVLGAFGDAVFGARWPGRPRLLSDDLRRPGDYTGVRDVAWAGAAVWVVSAACDAEVGAWDSDTYFLYSEETDYARRARDRGYAVRFVPTAGALHHGGGSGTSPALLALMSVNRIRYVRSVSSPWRARIFGVAVLLGHLLRAPRDPAHRHAAMVVADRRRWAELPGPPVREDGR